MTETLWMTLSHCARDSREIAETWDELGEQELSILHRELSQTYELWAEVFRALDNVPPGAPESYAEFKVRILDYFRDDLHKRHPTWTVAANARWREGVRRTIAEIKSGQHFDYDVRDLDGSGRHSCYCELCWESRQLWQYWGPPETLIPYLRDRAMSGKER